MDLLHPGIERVQSSLERQKTSHDKRVKDREFNLEDAVYVKNFAKGESWLPERLLESMDR